MMFHRLLGTASVVVLVAGCSSSPDSIGASYVSPLEYRALSCDQLGGELRRIGRRVAEVAGHQSDEATGDAVALGVGLIFWPALFFIVGGDREEELRRLKGEAEAIEQAAIRKDCGALLRHIDAERAAAAGASSGE